jgi:hypothetical protein
MKIPRGFNLLGILLFTELSVKVFVNNFMRVSKFALSTFLAIPIAKEFFVFRKFEFIVRKEIIDLLRFCRSLASSFINRFVIAMNHNSVREEKQHDRN